jgi:hypothetical protein
MLEKQSRHQPDQRTLRLRWQFRPRWRALDDSGLAASEQIHLLWPVPPIAHEQALLCRRPARRCLV